MKFVKATLALLVLAGTEKLTEGKKSYLKKAKNNKVKNTSKRRTGGNNSINVKVSNMSYRQIFSPFFYMTHRCGLSLYEFGEMASEGIEVIAETGSPEKLIEDYEGMEGVCMVGRLDGPTMPGNSSSIELPLMRGCGCYSIASMAILTNDCFVAVNGETIRRGTRFYPGLDSGTEPNTESSADVPGLGGTGAPDGGEGFVHIHRGIEGFANLTTADQWLNPMMRVQVY